MARASLFGRGYGSRIVEIGPRQNAAILDNEWLGFLLDVGLLGFLALFWTMARAVRRLGRIARRDPTDFGLLAGSVAASIVSFGVGMFTYDAFGFVQVALFCFALLALGSAVIALGEARLGTGKAGSGQLVRRRLGLDVVDGG